MLSKFNTISEHKKKYLLNFGWVFWGFIMRYALNILVSIYVVRYLQPVNFGKLNYATTYMQLLAPLAWLGLNAIITRDLIKAESELEKNKLLGTAFGLKAISSCLTILMVVCIIQFVENDTATKWMIFIATASLLVSPSGVLEFFFHSKTKAKYIVYSQQIAYSITAIIRVLLIIYEQPLIAFVVMVLVDALLTAVFLTLFYIRDGNSIKKWLFDNKLCKSILKEAPKMLIADFFVMFYTRIDLIMIEKMLNSKQLGIYSAAVKLSEPFNMVASLLITSLFPAIVNGLKINNAEYLSRMQRLCNILTWLAIFVSIAVSFSSELIIDVLYGKEYKESTSILTIYFWSSIFMFQALWASQDFMINKKQNFAILYMFGGAVLNVLLNLYLIPSYGIKGSAYATLISYAFSGFLFNGIFKSTRGVFMQQVLSVTAIFTKPRQLIQLFKIKD